MAGYIGSKAVTLSTTAADVAGNAVIDGDLTVKGTTVTIDSAAVQEIRLGDNDKMTFGDATGGDLQIYHDGTSSYIQDAGTGDLRLRGSNIVIESNQSHDIFRGIEGGAATIYHNNAAKLATTSTGIDVTGTVTADGLTVDGNARIEEIGAIAKLTLERGGTANSADSAAVDMLETNAGSEGANFGDLGTNGFRLKLDGSANDFLIQSGAANVVKTRFGIDRDTGDISFYEDTGTTAKFFWDASAESLGIGTSSPSRQLSLYGTLPAIAFQTSTSGTAGGDGFQIQANSTDVYLWNYENTPVRFGTNGSERMQINSSGNVGIGTTSPQRKIHSVDSNGQVLRLQRNGAFTGSWDLSIGTYATGDFTIYDNENSQRAITVQKLTGFSGTSAMYINSVGRVGIGTTTIDAQLNIETAANVTQPFAINDSSNTAGQTHRIAFRTGGTEVGTIKSTNSGTSFNTTSDYRLKENVTNVTDGITRVKQLSPKRFNFIVSPDITVDGFIAHEVQDIIPEAISGVKDAMRDEEYEVTPAVLDDDGNEVTPAVMGTRSVPEYQGIDQSKLVPLLTAALQEAIAKIETLETEMTSVKARLDALEAN